MPLNKEDLSFKKLISKEFTNPSRQFFQEVTTATLDISSTDIYSNVISSSTASAILDGYAKQYTLFTLTPDPTYPTTAWYFCSGSGFTPGTSTYDATKVQRNFISDKYGTEYEVKLYDNSNNQIFKTDAINWYFDYKTGILAVADPGTPSTYTTPYKVSVIQYIGDTLNTTLTDLSSSIGGGSGFPFSGSAVITGSLLISGSNVNELVVSGNIIATQGFTGSLLGDVFGTASWATNAISASYAATASTVTVIDNESTNSSYAIVFANPASGSGVQLQSDASTLTYNPSSSTLIIGGGTTPSFSLVKDTNVVLFQISASEAILNTANIPTFSIGNDASLDYINIGQFSDNNQNLTLYSNTVKVVYPLTASTISASSGITGSLFGTASWAVSASQALTASYVLNAISASFASTASYVLNAVSASFTSTASYVLNAVSASFASTASSVNTLNQNVIINGQLTAGTSSLANLTVTNNVIIDGDLFVYGSSSVINVENLSIEDKFILLNSGSKGPINNEGGIIVQTSASAGVAYGTALFYDQEANRWLIAKSSSVAFNATSITVGATTDYIVTVSASAGAPTGAPVNFGDGGVGNYSLGQMYIQTNTSDIYIYA